MSNLTNLSNFFIQIDNFTFIECINDKTMDNEIKLFDFHKFKGALYLNNINIQKKIYEKNTILFQFKNNLYQIFLSKILINNSRLNILFLFSKSKCIIFQLNIIECEWINHLFIIENSFPILINNIKFFKNLGNTNTNFIFSFNSELYINSSVFSDINLFSFSLYNSTFFISYSFFDKILMKNQINIIDQSNFSADSNIWTNFYIFNEFLHCVKSINATFKKNIFLNFTIKKYFISGFSLTNLNFEDSEIGKFSSLVYFLSKYIRINKINFENTSFYNFIDHRGIFFILNFCELRINNSTFFNHYFITNESTSSLLNLQFGEVSINNSFFNNIIFLNGGTAVIFFKNSDLKVLNSIFFINGFVYDIFLPGILSSECFGMFYLWNLNSIFFANNSFINDKTVSLFSGFILITSNKKEFNMEFCKFIELDMNKNYYCIGLILSNSPFILINNSRFINIKCSNYDFLHRNGPISLQFQNYYQYFDNNSSAIIYNCYFSNCKCDTGGSISIINYCFVFIKNSFIFNSIAKIGGAFAIISSNSVIFSNNTLHNLYSNIGSALYLFNINKIYIIFININNTKSLNHSTIMTRYVKITILENILIKNVLNYGDGGVMFQSGGNLFLSQGEFFNITSFGEGGLFFIKNKANISIYNITSLISSSLMGGIFHIDQAYLVQIEYSVFIKSNSIKSGACFYIELTSKIMINNIIMKNCTAALNGIIFIKNMENLATYIYENIFCSNNYATQGACIFFESLGDIYISNLFSTGNTENIIFITSFLLISIDLSNIFIEKTIYSKNMICLENIIGKCVNFTIMKYNIAQFVIILNDVLNFTFENATFVNYNKHFLFSPYVSIFHSFISFENIKFYQLSNSSRDLFLNFMYIEYSQVNLGFSNFSNNYYKKSSLIVIEASSLTMTSLCFNDNTGPILTAIDSQVLIFNCMFLYNTFYLEDIPNEFHVYSKYFHLNLNFIISNSVFIYKKGFHALIEGYNNIKYLNCMFEGMGNGSGLRVLDSDSVLINNSSFKNMHYFRGSVLLVISEENINKANTIIIDSCDFYNNIATLGGVFFTKGSNKINILNSNFDSNVAHFHQQDELYINNKNLYAVAGVGFIYGNNSIVYIINSSFINNFAFSMAPTIYSTVLIHQKNLFFSNNSDMKNFTHNISCYPLRFQLILKPDMVVSGESFALSFYLIDNYQNIIKTKDFLSAILLNNENKSHSIILNPISKPSRDGIFTFNNLIIKSIPNSNFSLSIKLIFKFQELDLVMNQKLSFFFKLFIRPCINGEIYEEDFSCRKCPNFHYSIEDPMTHLKNKLFCKDCQANAICLGGNYLIPKFGYWRYSSSSELIIDCLIQTACLGVPTEYASTDQLINNYMNYSNDSIIIHGLCKIGHHKNLCHECLFDYGKIFNENTCELCQSYLTYNLIRICFAFFIIFIVIILNVKVSPHKKEIDNISIIYKICVNHLQKISMITLFNFKNLVESLKETFSFVSIFSFINQNDFSNECFLKSIFGEIQNIYLFKSVITIITPFLITILFCLIFVFLSIIRKKFNRNILKKSFIIFIIAGFLFYPVINKTCLAMMNCSPLDDKSNLVYLSVSPNLECWTFFHYIFLFFVGIFGIIFWGMLFPIILFLIIKKNIQDKKGLVVTFVSSQTMDKNKTINNKNKILKNNKSVVVSENSSLNAIGLIDSNKYEFRKRNKFQHIQKDSLGFFYRDYKSTYYYWEIIIFLQKFLLCLIPNLKQFLLDELVNILFFSILLLYLWLLLVHLPFQLKEMNSLEISSVIICIFSRFFINLLVDSNDSNISFLGSTIVAFLNTLFFFLAIFYLIKLIKWKKAFMEIKDNYLMFKSSIRKQIKRLN